MHYTSQRGEGGLLDLLTCYISVNSTYNELIITFIKIFRLLLEIILKI